MSDKEFSSYLESFKTYSQKVTSSKGKSKKFLKNAGIYTSKNKLSKEFENLCIPQNRG